MHPSSAHPEQRRPSQPQGSPAWARARAICAERFGHAPTLAAWAPGRVNLLGEHVDYVGGCVLPMAIDRWCVAMACPAEGKLSRFFAADVGSPAHIDADPHAPLEGHTPPEASAPTGELWMCELGSSLQHLRGGKPPLGFAGGTWQSYVAGVADRVFAALRLHTPGVRVPALDVVITSDVPMGGGLASSAALELALAQLFLRASAASMDPMALATVCREAERMFAGVPCGIMDQAVVTLGKANHALLLQCREPYKRRPVPLPPSDQAVFVVVDTHVRHALAAGEYARRVDWCRQAEAKLQLNYLSDADEQTAHVHPALSEDERAAALHACTENQRVLAFAHALREHDWDACGELMHDSHASLRDVYRVSCPELDTTVDVASALPGVLGARMTGGGFGGCAVILCTPDAVPALRRNLTRVFTQRFEATCSVDIVHAADGAGSMALD